MRTVGTPTGPSDIWERSLYSPMVVSPRSSSTTDDSAMQWKVVRRRNRFAVSRAIQTPVTTPPSDGISLLPKPR
jgi:hypothetical protein